MAKYIDKDKIAAEIERLKGSLSPNFYEYDYDAAKVELLEKIEKFLDTIETKEVNLEKEAELIANGIMIPVQANLYHTNIYNFEKRCFKHSDLKEAARKGIEFGLKTKGE